MTHIFQREFWMGEPDPPSQTGGQMVRPAEERTSPYTIYMQGRERGGEDGARSR
jgi:hypothetical protein